MEVEKLKSLGEQIKEIRENQNLSQEEFGKKIGSARNTIANYENGNRNPSNSVKKSICREFGVNEAWLLTGIGEPYEELRPDERHILNIAKISKTKDEFIINAVEMLANEPEKLRLLENLMKELLGIK